MTALVRDIYSSYPFIFPLHLHISQALFSSKFSIMNIYVSNLGYTVSDEQLKKLFTSYGEVSSARVMMDKFSNRSRGFAFVDMPDEKAGQKAINELNGTMMDGRSIAVNQARPRKEL